MWGDLAFRGWVDKSYLLMISVLGLGVLIRFSVDSLLFGTIEMCMSYSNTVLADVIAGTKTKAPWTTLVDVVV